MPTFVAIDLGATSGRVVNVHVSTDRLELDVVRRFPTRTIDLGGGGLAWDVEALLAEVRQDLILACDRARVESVAVDSWAVDYGLLDSAGALVGPVHAYRSRRTDGVMERVVAAIGRERIYGITGIQFLPFNTLYQLAAAKGSEDLRRAARLLMLPDLVNHDLCGSTTNEVTNASTTQLLDAADQRWSPELVAACGVPQDVLPALHRPGARLGAVRGVDRRIDGLEVVAAGSHDTASAVVGTPLAPGASACYISCGTWALVGCELGAPVMTPAALDANVTNELGVDDTVRVLKNVTGLWLLEECRRHWVAHGTATTAAELAAAAESVPGGRSVIDPDDPRFATPGDMPGRVVEACRESGQPAPQSPAEVARVIFDSLALSWRAAVSTIERVTGTSAETLHLVGGGSSIPLLATLAADACGRPVVVGPAEATVVGNALVQAVAAGVIEGIAEGRRLVAAHADVKTVVPRPTLDWAALAERNPGS